MVDTRTVQSFLHDHCWPGSAAEPVYQSFSRQRYSLWPGGLKQQKGGIQPMVKMTELRNAEVKRVTIHYVTNSTHCAIVRSGIWPNPKARKRRVLTRWAVSPCRGEGGNSPRLAGALAGRFGPQRGWFLWYPARYWGLVAVPGGGSVRAALRGFVVWPAGLAPLINTKAPVARFLQCSCSRF